LPLKIKAKIGDTNTSFLIDTGASISILPYNDQYSYRIKPSNISITKASGYPVETYGEVDIEVGIPNIRRVFSWTFLVADVVVSILGLDLLARQSLLVDCWQTNFGCQNKL